MNKLFFRFRIFLIMIAFGSVSVSLFNMYEKWTEIPVNLPQVKSETPVNIFVLKAPKRVLCTVEDNGYCYCNPHSMGVAGGCAKLNEFYRLKDIENEKNGIF